MKKDQRSPGSRKAKTKKNLLHQLSTIEEMPLQLETAINQSSLQYEQMLTALGAGKLKSKMKFQTHYAGSIPGLEKISKKPSNTLPNQSMTITEIYKRYASGRSLSGVRSPEYDDDGSGKLNIDFDDYMPNLETLDLADRQQILEHTRLELDEVKKRLDGIAKARKLNQSKKEAMLLKRIQDLEKGDPEKKEVTPE